MSTLSLELREFSFPEELSNNRANFRVVFDVKYWTGSGARTTLKTSNAIKPGIDVFWECDRRKADRANFRRAGGPPDFEPRLDMDRLDDWDKVVVSLHSGGIHSVRAKLFDVDREDIWDKVVSFAGTLVRGIFGSARKVVTGVLPDALSGSAGDAIDEVSSYLVKKMAGGGDKVLFQGSARPERGSVEIRGQGTDGTYTIRLEVVEEVPPGEAAAEDSRDAD
ncbi:MAG: hypothetical protein ACE5HQ_10615 [Gemmatimonadota bacterium]